MTGSESKRPFGLVFCLSLGLMLYELCLTRVLSTIFFHHTAFLALSVAFLGLGAGALAVKVLRLQTARKVIFLPTVAGLTACLFPSVAPTLALAPEDLSQLTNLKLVAALAVSLATTCLPFFCGGAALACLFESEAERFSSLYAVDLVGAGLGTLAMIPVMEVMGGPAALFFAAGIISLSGLFAAVGRAKWLAIASSLLVLGFSVLSLTTATFSIPVLLSRADHDPNSGRPPQVLYEKWNAFSRVAVIENAGWDRGLSAQNFERLGPDLPEQREALIDVNAFAAMVAFDGDLESVAHLKDLVSNIGFRVAVKKPRVAIIGPGGGKDVLGALLFDAQEVVGIELNAILVHDLVRDTFRDFCGDLYRDPRVRIIVGDGRSELSRLDGPFDLIIANSVATWAAQGTGAMNLSEHQIFTQEAFELYREKLSPAGILSISLWDEAEHSVPLRLISTWMAAIGTDAAEVAVIANPWDELRSFSTILLKAQPFSPSERQDLVAASEALGFEVDYLRGRENESAVSFVEFFADPEAYRRVSPHDLSAATDDRPFVFYTLRLADALAFWRPLERSDNAAYAALVLSFFLVLILVMGLIATVSWWSQRQGASWGTTKTEACYFGMIGFGFMTVEVALIQRLNIILGHPSYSLTVALGGLLVWSGSASRLSARLHQKWSGPQLDQILVLVAGIIALYCFVIVPFLQHALTPFATEPRLLLLFISLALPGLAMGLPMPLALRQLRRGRAEAIPMAFGINSALTVLASVTTILVAVLFGFQMSLGLGVLAYLGAAGAAFIRNRASASSGEPTR